jgi:hypothetical protein
MIDRRLFMDLEEQLEPLGAAVDERSLALEARESLSSVSGAELLDSCWRCLCMRSSSPRLGAEALAGELLEKVMESGSLRCLKISVMAVFYETKGGADKNCGQSEVQTSGSVRNTTNAGPSRSR